MSQKKFKLFDFTKDGKGVSKAEAEDVKPNLSGFFKQYKNKFSRLLSVNIFMVLCNFPIFFAGLALAGYGAIRSTAPASVLYPIVSAMEKFDPSPVSAALKTIFGLQSPLTAFSTGSFILFGLSLLTLFTFGLTNVGTTYLLRNLARGDAVFMWSDFWYAVKRNLKQGILLGILDLVVSFLMVFNLRYYYGGLNGGFAGGIMFYLSLAMLILWFYMRFYMYLLLVTFDLSIPKILKNSLIFSIIGFKRNFMATLGILVLLLLNYMVFVYIQPLGIVLPLVLTLSNGAFMSTYAAYFKIKEIMIDPYADKPEAPSEEPLAKDDVSN